MSECRRFLKALFGDKPDKLFILLWTLPEKRSHWFRNVADAVQFAEARKDRNLYVGVALSPGDYGAKKRCESKDIAALIGMWSDLDLHSDAHKKGNLPKTVEEALSVCRRGCHRPWLLTPAMGFTFGGCSMNLSCWKTPSSVLTRPVWLPDGTI